jgi:hypothetical protein
MIGPLLGTFGRNLDYAKRLVADLDDDRMSAQPAPGMNHAAWVLGHLAWTCDFTGQVLGLPETLDATWTERFNNESRPAADRALYPPKGELVATLEAAHARLDEALRAAPSDVLTQPLPLEQYRSFFPTVGDALFYMLTSHEAVHLGQLSAWRRVLGLPSV